MELKRRWQAIKKFIEFYFFDTDESLLKEVNEIIPGEEVKAPEGVYGFRFLELDGNNKKYISKMFYLGIVTTLENIAKISVKNIPGWTEHPIIIDRCGDYHKFSEDVVVVEAVTRWNKQYLN